MPNPSVLQGVHNMISSYLDQWYPDERWYCLPMKDGGVQVVGPFSYTTYPPDRVAELLNILTTGLYRRLEVLKQQGKVSNDHP